ncbi:hypothetical protein AK812_SmicGene35611 [Symbiodinium microadriaticum]|uniref:Uncharacterized protein n=1 Tax=Symbiodinium microadriaticum TaxID=2951 RepID=A0A1Q9CL20_SYMMI|nr:hypothetical protein AK812_SmicGene35611 [Symbiodinium microadriaticum]
MKPFQGEKSRLSLTRLEYSVVRTGQLLENFLCAPRNAPKANVANHACEIDMLCYTTAQKAIQQSLSGNGNASAGSKGAPEDRLQRFYLTIIQPRCQQLSKDVPSGDESDAANTLVNNDDYQNCHKSVEMGELPTMGKREVGYGLEHGHVRVLLKGSAGCIRINGSLLAATMRQYAEVPPEFHLNAPKANVANHACEIDMTMRRSWVQLAVFARKKKKAEPQHGQQWQLDGRQHYGSQDFQHLLCWWSRGAACAKNLPADPMKAHGFTMSAMSFLGPSPAAEKESLIAASSSLDPHCAWTLYAEIQLCQLEFGIGPGTCVTEATQCPGKFARKARAEAASSNCSLGGPCSA